MPLGEDDFARTTMSATIDKIQMTLFANARGTRERERPAAFPFSVFIVFSNSMLFQTCHANRVYMVSV